MLKRIFAVGDVLAKAAGLLSTVLTIVGFYFLFPDNKLPKWADMMSSAHPGRRTAHDSVPPLV